VVDVVNVMGLPGIVTVALFLVNGIEGIGSDRMRHSIECEQCGETFSYEEDDLEEDQDFINCEHCDWPNPR
jgi:formylmethanofuran dehydrogenase subunit E